MEPKRPQKVVTSGGEVITSGPENCVKREISIVGIKVKLGNVHENQRYSKPSISNTYKIVAQPIEIPRP